MPSLGKKVFFFSFDIPMHEATKLLYVYCMGLFFVAFYGLFIGKFSDTIFPKESYKEMRDPANLHLDKHVGHIL